MALLVYARFNNALRQYSNHGAKMARKKGLTKFVTEYNVWHAP
jgi:hypothetical protein